MPFRSKSQVRTCFTTRPKGWNCEQWLKETPHPESLPEKLGGSPGRKSSRGNHTIGPIKRGARGGKYRMIGGIKVYFSRKSSDSRRSRKSAKRSSRKQKRRSHKLSSRRSRMKGGCAMPERMKGHGSKKVVVKNIEKVVIKHKNCK